MAAARGHRLQAAQLLGDVVALLGGRERDERQQDGRRQPAAISANAAAARPRLASARSGDGGLLHLVASSTIPANAASADCSPLSVRFVFHG